MGHWWSNIWQPPQVPAPGPGPWETWPWPAPEVQWQKCPVCEGRGTVPGDFYGSQEIPGSTSVQLKGRVGCRTCGGRGILPMTAHAVTSTGSTTSESSQVDRSARTNGER